LPEGNPWHDNFTAKGDVLTPDQKNLRIEGIYVQRQEGYFMQRVKLAAGVISAQQARTVAEVAETFGKGTIHLTSRGSMEVHWLQGEDLPAVKRNFAMVGLTSRGACGGAVRGVSCSSQGAAEFPQLESLARRLQRHFTGNPRFEGLPKKFKIGIETDTTGGRHLIQDVGLVLTGADSGMTGYDVWIAGGLGREPRAGFLLERGVREEGIIPVIEAVIAVYVRLVPPPKRLKSLAATLGETELRRLIEAEPAYGEVLLPVGGFPDGLTESANGKRRVVIPVFAGQLTADQLRGLAAFADRHAGGAMQVTADQDIAFVSGGDTEGAVRELTTQMNACSATGAAVTFRICPGSHECRMGLAATRDLAGTLIAEMNPAAMRQAWAISGCPNSCTQPQLAAAGIVVSKLVAGEDGVRTPRFDLYRSSGAGLGEKVGEQMTFAGLTEFVREFEG
jgi:sulfite reductase (ferredoxin)